MFRDHISEKINKAYSILGIIKRNLRHGDMYRARIRVHGI